MNSPSSPELSIVILCRDEEGSIAHCVQEAREFLAANAISGEVLVVDNASRDRSAAHAEAAGARVVPEHRPGYGNAILAGIAAARGRFTILGDGDGEHDLRALEPFWEKLHEGHDIVFGNRFLRAPQAGAMPSFLRRHVGNPLLSGLGKLMFRSPVGDFHCGLKGFRTESVRGLALRSPGMEMASEIIVKAILAGLRMCEVPVVQRPALDPNRTSHLRIWRDGWNHLRLLLLLSPGWLFLWPGCLLLAAGLALVALPLIWTPEPVGGGLFGVYTMIFGAAFAVAGAQIAVFSLPARVFHENLGATRGVLTAALIRGKWLPGMIVASIALMLLGAAGAVWSLFVWAATGSLDLEPRLRVLIPSTTLLILGLQLLFSTFFLSLLVSRENSRSRGSG